MSKDNKYGAWVFQSTLPREERQSWRTHSLKGVNFNPRSHERSDKKSVDDGDMMSISIHAPTRGATLTDCTFFVHQKFQSTLPREERHLQELKYLPCSVFQSTLPREERPIKSPVMSMYL